ncbi:hypothetical protein EC9_54230 [Rosistilla ulvae]|uniref:Uncharacterized protein n=1 Tax=Rosistilla ulvae TaxID=1930277 RepID=A0A517M8I8_9BACT|nr:hypothetical protein EC9_54230 [Rosistilla ulvae]
MIGWLVAFRSAKVRAAHTSTKRKRVIVCREFTRLRFVLVFLARIFGGDLWLTDDLAAVADVIPDDEAIEVFAAGKDHPAFGAFG